MKDTNPLRSFQERNVRVFFGGLAISSIGTWAQLTAVILLVRELGGGGLELGIVTACQFLPTLLIGLYAGAVADRSDRHRLIMALQAAMGVQALVLAIVTFSGAATIPLVYGLTIVFGLLNAFDGPSRRTFSTELVTGDRLANVLSLATSVITGARMFGPAMAAILVAVAGPGWVFLLNGVTYLAFLFAMRRMDESRFHPLARAPQSRTPVRDGLREVWSVPELRITVILFAVIATFAYNHLVGFPLLVAERLMEDESLFGWLLSAMSIGNVFGSLMIARLTIVRSRWMYGSAILLSLSLAGVALSTQSVATFLLVIPLGLAATSLNNASTILVQQKTDDGMRSRIMALMSVLFLGSTPIGGPITGAVGDAFGAMWANLYGALIAGAATAIALLLTWLGRTRRSAIPQSNAS